MERTKVKGWNRARKFLAKYAGNRIIIEKVHNYYTISVYPQSIWTKGTLTYFEYWKKIYWEAMPTGTLKQNIKNTLKHTYISKDTYIFQQLRYYRSFCGAHKKKQKRALNNINDRFIICIMSRTHYRRQTKSRETPSTIAFLYRFEILIIIMSIILDRIKII